MTIKERTAVVSIISNTALTFFKFAAFFFTGSVAILAEAWHSFSDITTSILVLISVKEKPLLVRKEEGKSRAIPLEYEISLSIGILMFFVSILLMWKAATKRILVIENPLFSGIMFIVFAVASYIVYRFETSVGEKEKSVALIADGMHAKADMVNSLLIGFYLVIYKVRPELVYVDTIVAFVIALLILSFSIEIIVNAVVAHKRGEEGFTFKYKSIAIVLSLFDKETWNAVLKYLEKKLGLKIVNVPLLKKTLKYFCAVLILILVLMYASTCIYTINPSQEGIVERFGKPVDYKRPMQPGMHLKFPWLVDRIVRVDSKTIRAKSIGNITDKSSFALLWTRKHGTEIPFLSGDNNFFYPYLVIHYRIKDIFKYEYNHINSDVLLDNVAPRVISNIFSRKEFYQIVTSYRKQFELDVTEIIQRKLDELDSGLEIINVNVKDAHPPIFIADSFERVIAAYQEKEKLINQAIGYKNKLIPEARGEREKILKQAESYVVSKTSGARGETSRFIMQLAGYRKAPTIAAKKMYFDLVKESLSENRKVIVDPSSGYPEIWLDFDQLFKATKYKGKG